MNKDLIHKLTNDFESYAQQTEGGVEFWLARDLQHLLGYTKWDNFTNVISKAKTACEVSGHNILDHFVDVNKMVARDEKHSLAGTGKLFTTARTLHKILSTCTKGHIHAKMLL